MGMGSPRTAFFDERDSSSCLLNLQHMMPSRSSSLPLLQAVFTPHLPAPLPLPPVVHHLSLLLDLQKKRYAGHYNFSYSTLPTWHCSLEPKKTRTWAHVSVSFCLCQFFVIQHVSVSFLWFNGDSTTWGHVSVVENRFQLFGGMLMAKRCFRIRVQPFLGMAARCFLRPFDSWHCCSQSVTCVASRDDSR